MEIYTDGGCSGNPGPGGWGVYFPDIELKLNGTHQRTTNNRMELTAIVKALEAINCGMYILYTDSIYCYKGITMWKSKWKKNNWKKIKNKDLWIQIDNLLQKDISIEWKWVKAHDGNEGNEIADKLATMSL